MTLAMILLLLVGLLLVFLEAFVPGGVLGTIGAACIAVSAWFCYQEFGAMVAFIYLLVAMVLGTIIGFSAFLMIARKMAIAPDAEKEEPDDLRRLVGKSGRVLVDCDPTGLVEVEGRRIQARAEYSEQEILHNTPIEVLKVDSTFLVVRELEEAE